MRKIFMYFLFISINAVGQKLEIPLSRFYLYANEIYMSKSDSITDFTVKPVLFESGDLQTAKSKSRIINSLFYRKPIQVTDTGFYLAVYPLMYLETTKDYISKKQLSFNTRGITLEGRIGENVIFTTDFYENQAFLSRNQADFADKYLVIPGQGATKIFNTSGYDFSSASGRVSFSPKSNLNFTLGHGKHFIGNGYRSLFLSDNSYNYPFFRASISFGKFNYTAIYAQFTEFKHKYYDYHSRKHGSFGVLTWKPIKSFNLSFLSASVWQTSGIDYANLFRAELFIPPIVSPFFEYKNDSKTSMFGLNGVVYFLKQFSAYTQALVHNFKLSETPEFAFQQGVKCYDVFFDSFKSIKWYMQFEINYISENYGAGENEYMGFTHYNQALAHPAGNNLAESVFISSFTAGRINLNYKFNAIKGYKASNSVLSGTSFNFIDYSTPSVTGIEKSTTYQNFELAFTLNPAYSLQLAAGAYYYKNSLSVDNPDLSVYFALRTNLRNSYFDF